MKKIEALLSYFLLFIQKKIEPIMKTNIVSSFISFTRKKEKEIRNIERPSQRAIYAILFGVIAGSLFVMEFARELSSNHETLTKFIWLDAIVYGYLFLFGATPTSAFMYLWVLPFISKLKRPKTWNPLEWVLALMETSVFWFVLVLLILLPVFGTAVYRLRVFGWADYAANMLLLISAGVFGFLVWLFAQESKCTSTSSCESSII
ncbi:Uncharacterised protein [uncultured archaeon]|nr:Uncharacterised protein [uncultured archaeon]